MPENENEDVVSDDEVDVGNEDEAMIGEDDLLLDADVPVGLEPPVLELPTTPLAAGRLAFYEGQLEDAIEQFSEVVESEEYDPDSRAKAMYWRAEARLQQDYSRAAVDRFDEVAGALPGHHLGTAASERARELETHFDAIDHPDPVAEDAGEA